MNSYSYLNTPNFSEELVEIEKYIINHGVVTIELLIGKTNENIIIRSAYYEIKIAPENLSILTKVMFKSLDESFIFIRNLFEQNKVKIKEITHNNIKLGLNTYDIINGKEKEFELILIENYDNKRYLFKDIYNKLINFENEIKEIKKNNKILKEENFKLNQENNNLRQNYINIQMEINNLKNSYMIDNEKL